mmetsp:Transcript_25099/g.94870  ORF Transcript_25099/g.94870 Transcript_25099/m.94870 type:complete len:210 (-) Transcript_25099:527-1156(-)
MIELKRCVAHVTSARRGGPRARARADTPAPEHAERVVCKSQPPQQWHSVLLRPGLLLANSCLLLGGVVPGEREGRGLDLRVHVHVHLGNGASHELDEPLELDLVGGLKQLKLLSERDGVVELACPGGHALLREGLGLLDRLQQGRGEIQQQASANGEWPSVFLQLAQCTRADAGPLSRSPCFKHAPVLARRGPPGRRRRQGRGTATALA